MKVVSRKLIKPQKPTPENLKKLNLSFIDELAAPLNMGFVLLYQNDPIIMRSPDERRRRLQESLSETLTEFYPLAGRYMKEEHYVDCADQGVEWVDAEAEAELMEKTTAADDQLTDLLPRQLKQIDPESALASIQMTVFKCGGVAIGVSISHRIFDGPSVRTFLKAWSSSSSSSSSSSIIIRPSFDLAALFPRNLGYMARLWQLMAAGGDQAPSSTAAGFIVAKRFRFNKEAIASVRSRYIDLPPRVSRVRVVSAVITKALMGVERRRKSAARPTVAVQMVDMRGRTILPVPDHSCGNMVAMSVTAPCIMNNQTSSEDADDDDHIRQLVDLFGEGLKGTISEFASPEATNNPYDMVMAPFIKLGTIGETNVLFFTDVSKLGLYQFDFGWGKPVGVGAGELPHQNSILLMETKDPHGLDAWVHLTPDDMACFQQDQDIRNLSVFIA